MFPLAWRSNGRAAPPLPTDTSSAEDSTIELAVTLFATSPKRIADVPIPVRPVSCPPVPTVRPAPALSGANSNIAPVMVPPAVSVKLSDRTDTVPPAAAIDAPLPMVRAAVPTLLSRIAGAVTAPATVRPLTPLLSISVRTPVVALPLVSVPISLPLPAPARFVAPPHSVAPVEALTLRLPATRVPLVSSIEPDEEISATVPLPVPPPPSLTRPVPSNRIPLVPVSEIVPAETEPAMVRLCAVIEIALVEPPLTAVPLAMVSAVPSFRVIPSPDNPVRVPIVLEPPSAMVPTDVAVSVVVEMPPEPASVMAPTSGVPLPTAARVTDPAVPPVAIEPVLVSAIVPALRLITGALVPRAAADTGAEIVRLVVPLFSAIVPALEPAPVAVRPTPPSVPILLVKLFSRKLAAVPARVPMLSEPVCVTVPVVFRSRIPDVSLNALREIDVAVMVDPDLPSRSVCAPTPWKERLPLRASELVV